MASIIERIENTRKQISQELNLHPPSRAKQFLAELGIREILPSDITKQPETLRHVYRHLGGDPEIGRGNDGHCQSWRNNPNWWKDIV